MFSLYFSLAFLGLAAIDPIGIGIMPILLMQKQPFKRAFIFLCGSFISLMAMGLLFVKGVGEVVLRFEDRSHWFVSLTEILGGTILLIIATTAFWQLKLGNTHAGLSERTRKWLNYSDWHLFVFGALLVAAQSILDVVFVIAMIRVGQLQPSNLVLIFAVGTYAVMALLLQFVVIVAFRLTPIKQRDLLSRKVRNLLTKYSYETLGVVSLGLSVLLFILATSNS